MGLREFLKLALAALVALGLGAGSALALDPEERLEDPALEAKARSITKLLRCVVCDNASVDDSDAQVAKNMRQLVRQRVTEGRSADEIKDEFVQYYGEYVLLQPRFSASNFLIWAAAPLSLILGVFLIGRLTGGRAPAEAQATTAREAPLSDAERQRLDDLLKD